PVTQAQLQAWIREGRLLPESQVSRSDDGPWRQANQFVELTWTGQTPVTAPPPLGAPQTSYSPATAPTQFGDSPMLEHKLRNGASWFYWIAGLSAINTLSAISGGGFFVVGLSITRIIEFHATRLGGNMIATSLSILVIGLFVLFGVFAYKRHL